MGYRAEQRGMLSPVRLGKEQDDGEAFWVVFWWCLVCWLVVLIV